MILNYKFSSHYHEDNRTWLRWHIIALLGFIPVYIKVYRSTRWLQT